MPLIKMLLLPYIGNSHLSAIIGLMEVDGSTKKKEKKNTIEQRSKGLVWLGLYYELIPQDLVIVVFRYGTNLLMGKGRTCCMLGHGSVRNPGLQSLIGF